jgi:Ca-activated chloride channel family protein
MSFTYPEVFLLIALVPLMLASAILASRSRGRAWKRLVATRLRPILVTAGSPAPRWISHGLALAAFILVIAALAGPNAGYRKETETIRGRNLLLAIDISRSMLAEDESPNRLAAALAAALEVIDQFPNERIGVIAFSGSPFLLAPLTVDHGAIRETLQQLDPVTLRELDADYLPRGGSDIAQAVRLATDTLRETGQKNNALILFTDGETHDGGIEEAADAAADGGLTIFTAGFGSEEGTFIPDPRQKDQRLRDRSGDLVFSRLESEQLRLLARRTGGFHTHGSGRYFAQNLETAVEQLDRFELEGRKRRVAIPRFQWFLLPAIMLFIASILVNTPWRLLARSATAGLALWCLLPDTAEARLLPGTGAERAYAAGDYERALGLFTRELDEARGERRTRLQLGAGAAAYRLEDFPRASRAYSDALLSSSPVVQEEAHYALANSLFFRGRGPLESAGEEARSSARVAAIALWTDALGHYEGTLAISPGHEGAKHNHEVVRKRLEELQREQEQQEQENQQNQENQDDPNNDDPDKSGKDNPEGESPEGNKPKNPEDPDKPEIPKENGDQPEDNPGEGEQNPDPEDPGEEDGRDEREMRPDESPEDRARRILAENADFQSTPMMPRRAPRRRPEKDW